MASHRTSGVVGFFDDERTLIDATRQVRDQNYESFDTFTPYPVHGLEQAQGLKRSWLPWVTFVAGLTGGTCGFGLQLWTSAVDWPIVVGGKPFNSWPAFIPITFELTVLFAALATVGAMFVANRLPNTKHRIVDTSITRDRFALVIDNPKDPDPDDRDDPKARARLAKFKPFSEGEAKLFLQKAGAKDVRSYHDEGWF